jgi:pilus assembly protein FimV
MHKTLRLIVIAILLAISPAVLALGLGEADVRSFLNQPLDVRIQLISEPGERATVEAGLAAASDFDLVGLNRGALSVPLQFEVIETGEDAFIVMKSTLPVADPVVQVLVEVTWSGGRMLREYTLFLDPPTFEAPAPPPQTVPESVPVVTGPLEATEAAPASPVVSNEPESRIQPASKPASVPASPQGGSEYGPVKSGETLWGIATNWSRGSGYSINQAMMAIQRENPKAFNRGNINSLKRGAILRLPDTAVMGELSVREAMAETARQEDEFYGRQAPPATERQVATPEVATIAEVAVETEQEPVIESGAEIEAVPLDEGETAAADAEAEFPAEEEITGHLELVPPGEGDLDAINNSGEMTADAGQEDVGQSSARTEEELVNAQQENAYLNERIRELEQQVQEAKAAVVVADQDMAAMQAQMRENRQTGADSEAEAWYSGKTLWLGGLAILVVLFLIGLARRGRGDHSVSVLGDGDNAGADTVQAIREEAEELLDTLDTAEDTEHEEETVIQVADSAPSAQTDDRFEGETAVMAEPLSEDDRSDAGEDEATVITSTPSPSPEQDDIDETDSNDPEIKLDLARAYLSMGDREASRVMLEEVLAVGSEEQQAEARAMLEEF